VLSLAIFLVAGLCGFAWGLLTPGVSLESPKASTEVSPNSAINLNVSGINPVIEQAQLFVDGKEVPVKITIQDHLVTMNHKLDTDHSYRLEVTVKSPLGIKKKRSYKFKTATSPRVTSVKVDGKEDAGENVDLKPSIKISFSEPVKPSSLDITLNDRPIKDMADIKWDEEYLTAAVSFKEELSQGTHYTLTIKQGTLDARGYEMKEDRAVNFTTIEPLVADIKTVKATEDTAEVRISFNKPVDKQKAESHISLPSRGKRRIDWSEDTTANIKITGLSSGGNYKVAIKKGLVAEDGGYLEEDKSLSVTIKQSAASMANITADGKLIVVSKSRQQVYIYEGGDTPIKTYSCSTGKVWPPKGNFKVYSKSAKSSSPKYGVYFDHMVRFWKPSNASPVGFHSLVYDSSGNVVDADKLGQPVSHGCVRMPFEGAEFIYNWAPMGTKVQVID